MEIYFRYPCSNRAFTGIVFLFVLIFGMNANLPVPVVIGDDRMVTPRFISLPDLFFVRIPPAAAGRGALPLHPTTF